MDEDDGESSLIFSWNVKLESDKQYFKLDPLVPTKLVATAFKASKQISVSPVCSLTLLLSFAFFKLGEGDGLLLKKV